jgi:hypothetical protein
MPWHMLQVILSVFFASFQKLPSRHTMSDWELMPAMI